MQTTDAKKAIIEAGRSAYSCGLVSAAGGNISMKLGGRYFITATNAPLRCLNMEDILEIDMSGNVVGETYGGKRPSKETVLHLEIYKNRPDIDCVIHVHPVFSIACSIAFPNSFPILTVSGINKIGKIGYISYAQPGSEELVMGARKVLTENDADMKTIILERHGILVFDKGMETCYERTELVEETAKVGIYSTLARRMSAALDP